MVDGPSARPAPDQRGTPRLEQAGRGLFPRTLVAADHDVAGVAVDEEDGLVVGRVAEEPAGAQLGLRPGADLPVFVGQVEPGVMRGGDVGGGLGVDELRSTNFSKRSHCIELNVLGCDGLRLRFLDLKEAPGSRQVSSLGQSGYGKGEARGAWSL